MSNRWLGRVFWAVGLIVLAMWLVRRPSDPLRDELQQLRAATVPPQARIFQEPALRRTNDSASATWELETDWTWPRYAEWVSRNLTATYTALETAQPPLILRRNLPGDVFYLKLQPTMTGAVHRVRATFTAYPD